MRQGTENKRDRAAEVAAQPPPAPVDPAADPARDPITGYPIGFNAAEYSAGLRGRSGRRLTLGGAAAGEG